MTHDKKFDKSNPKSRLYCSVAVEYTCSPGQFACCTFSLCGALSSSRYVPPGTVRIGDSEGTVNFLYNAPFINEIFMLRIYTPPDAHAKA